MKTRMAAFAYHRYIMLGEGLFNSQKSRRLFVTLSLHASMNLIQLHALMGHSNLEMNRKNTNA